MKKRDRIPVEIGDRALWKKVKRQAKIEKRTAKAFLETALERYLETCKSILDTRPASEEQG